MTCSTLLECSEKLLMLAQARSDRPLHSQQVWGVAVLSDGGNIVSNRVVRVWEAIIVKGLLNLDECQNWSFTGKILDIGKDGWVLVTDLADKNSVLLWIPHDCRGVVALCGSVVVAGTPAGIVMIEIKG